MSTKHYESRRSAGALQREGGSRLPLSNGGGSMSGDGGGGCCDAPPGPIPCSCSPHNICAHVSACAAHNSDKTVTRLITNTQGTSAEARTHTPAQRGTYRVRNSNHAGGTPPYATQASGHATQASGPHAWAAS